MFGEQALRDSGYFKAGEVKRLRHLHRSGQGNHSRALNGILGVQLWHYDLLR
jgi:hypothetical protein